MINCGGEALPGPLWFCGSAQERRVVNGWWRFLRVQFWSGPKFAITLDWGLVLLVGRVKALQFCSSEPLLFCVFCSPEPLLFCSLELLLFCLFCSSEPLLFCLCCSSELLLAPVSAVHENHYCSVHQNFYSSVCSVHQNLPAAFPPSLPSCSQRLVSARCLAADTKCSDRVLWCIKPPLLLCHCVTVNFMSAWGGEFLTRWLWDDRWRKHDFISRKRSFTFKAQACSWKESGSGLGSGLWMCFSPNRPEPRPKAAEPLWISVLIRWWDLLAVVEFSASSDWMTAFTKVFTERLQFSHWLMAACFHITINELTTR